jgi:hypothetical protein
MPAYDAEQMERADDVIYDWIYNGNKANYYMLLCKELSYYTVFHSEDNCLIANDFIAELWDVLRGMTIRDVSVDTNGNSVGSAKSLNELFGLEEFVGTITYQIKDEAGNLGELRSFYIERNTAVESTISTTVNNKTGWLNAYNVTYTSVTNGLLIDKVEYYFVDTEGNTYCVNELEAGVEENIISNVYKISFGYEKYSLFLKFIEKYKQKTLSSDFAEGVKIKIAVPSDEEDFCEKLTDYFLGKVEIVKESQIYVVYG